MNDPEVQKVDEDNLVLSVDLPGYEKDNIKVYSESGYLVVSAKSDTRKYYRRWELPENEKVGVVRYINGVLKIELQRILTEKEKRLNYQIE
jgi:HSP20 family molecular chaperone IbpA